MLLLKIRKCLNAWYLIGQMTRTECMVRKCIVCVALILMWVPRATFAADWPQFMHDACHSGDASAERLETPLGLVAQIALEDAVFSSPVVGNGRVYVVDQMATVYCVDPDRAEILWKKSPEGRSTFGTNTSSPCVAGQRVYFGTAAGNLHILDAKSGKQFKSVDLQWPILNAITLANDSVYFQTLNGVIHCLDLDGNVRWTWTQQRLPVRTS
jgi:FOG: WD40-like repeat